MEARDRLGSRPDTVVVSGVPTDVLPADRMKDKLTIHFQSRRRSDGGDVKEVHFHRDVDGLAFVTFGLREDADKVLRKWPQVMHDEEFPQDYELTVFPFSEDVFHYVSHTVLDLSVFDDQAEALMRKLQSRHRSIRFMPLSEQRKAVIEGPFSAVKELRQQLICRVRRLQKYNVSTQSPPADPQDGAEAGRAPSEDTQGSEEAVPSFRKNGERVDGGGAESVPDTSRKPKTEPLQRQVVGEERSEETTSSLRALSLQPASGPQQPEEKEESADSDPSATETLQGAASLLAVQLHDLGPEDFWVDLYIFEYVNTFHRKELDECLGGVAMTYMYLQECDLVQVSLREPQPSLGPSRIQEVSKALKSYLEAWQCTLEVHEILVEQHERNLRSICEILSSMYDDVLYTFRASQLKIVGPREHSYQFYRRVQDRLLELRYR